jgi:hypothetical protein
MSDIIIPQNKTNRKNKTNQVVSWPTSHFTIRQLWQEHNPHFPAEITIRDRLTKAIAANLIDRIGTIHIKMGRPTLVFAAMPITEDVLTAAKSSGVTLNEKYGPPIVPIMNVDPAVVNVNAQPSEKANKQPAIKSKQQSPSLAVNA